MLLESYILIFIFSFLEVYKIVIYPLNDFLIIAEPICVFFNRELSLYGLNLPDKDLCRK